YTERCAKAAWSELQNHEFTFTRARRLHARQRQHDTSAALLAGIHEDGCMQRIVSRLGPDKAPPPRIEIYAEAQRVLIPFRIEYDTQQASIRFRRQISCPLEI